MEWGAFTNAASAMTGMSYDLNTIGQNISNMNTTGYKTSETDFHTQLSEVVGAPASSVNSGEPTKIFGVGWSDRTNITQQGSIVGTNTWTNIAIDGNGFFMVAPPSSTGTVPTTANLASSTGVQYTRAGDFTQLAGAAGQSYLVDGSGNYVLGWMADPTGAIQTGTLAPVYTLPTTVMAGSATTAATVAANIPADAAITPNTVNTNVSLNLSGGGTDTMQLTWTRVDGNTWTATPAATSTSGNAVSPAGAITVVEDSNQSITSPSPSTMTFTTTDASGNAQTASVNLSSYLPSYSEQMVQVQAYDSNGTSHSVNLGFENLGNNQWYIHAVVPATENTPTAKAVVTTAPVSLSFDGAGNLLSPASMSIGVTWANGLSNTIAVDTSKLTQYSGSSVTVNAVNQNGYASGTLIAQAFTAQGVLVGQFDNGQTRNLFQVPVATFVSENSLTAVSGTNFERSTAAGDVTVSAIGTSPADGQIVPSSVESSTVDITQQFTNMILAQKAYSSNSQVFKIADEMTTTVRDLQT